MGVKSTAYSVLSITLGGSWDARYSVFTLRKLYLCRKSGGAICQVAGAGPTRTVWDAWIRPVNSTRAYSNVEEAALDVLYFYSHGYSISEDQSHISFYQH